MCKQISYQYNKDKDKSDDLNDLSAYGDFLTLNVFVFVFLFVILSVEGLQFERLDEGIVEIAVIYFKISSMIE